MHYSPFPRWCGSQTFPGCFDRTFRSLAQVRPLTAKRPPRPRPSTTTGHPATTWTPSCSSSARWPGRGMSYASGSRWHRPGPPSTTAGANPGPPAKLLLLLIWSLLVTLHSSVYYLGGLAKMSHNIPGLVSVSLEWVFFTEPTKPNTAFFREGRFCGIWSPPSLYGKGQNRVIQSVAICTLSTRCQWSPNSKPF